MVQTTSTTAPASPEVAVPPLSAEPSKLGSVAGNTAPYSTYFALVGTDAEAATRHLAELLQLPSYESDARSAVRLDYITYALRFAREAGYGPRRVNALIDVANAVLDATIAGASCTQVQATFQSLMLNATSPKPGSDSELFSPDQVAQVAQYFGRTFFRHFRLYAYVYSTPQDLTESSATLLVETAIVPSFDAALSESDWFQALEDKRAAEEAAAAEAEAAALAAEEAAAIKAAEEAAIRAEAQRQEDLLRKPATLEDAIEHQVAVRLEAEKLLLSEEYRAKEEAMLRKIQELELKATAVNDKGKKGKGAAAAAAASAPPPQSPPA